MKARVKATGEIVELADSCYLNDKDYQHSYYADEREGIESESDYWTRLEHQYAGMAMQGILSGKWVEMMYAAVGNDGQYRDLLTNKAKEFAHALVQKMKEERK